MCARGIVNCLRFRFWTFSTLSLWFLACLPPRRPGSHHGAVNCANRATRRDAGFDQPVPYGKEPTSVLFTVDLERRLYWAELTFFRIDWYWLRPDESKAIVIRNRNSFLEVPISPLDDWPLGCGIL